MLSDKGIGSFLNPLALEFVLTILNRNALYSLFPYEEEKIMVFGFY
jgi:hypothetical protein